MIGVPCLRFLHIEWRICSITIVLLASNLLAACGASPPEGPWWLELSREETQGGLTTLTLVAAIPLEIDEEGGFAGTGDFQGEIVLASAALAGCGWHAHWDGPMSLNGQYRDGSLDFDQMATLGGPSRAHWVCDEKAVGPAQPIEEIGDHQYKVVPLMVAQIKAAWDQAAAYEKAREESTNEEFTPEIKVEDGAEAEVAGWRIVLHQGKPPFLPPPTPYPTARQTATPQPVTVHVNPEGSGDYPGLEAAVESVPPGSTITLAAGVHLLSGPLEITKTLQLTGAGMDETEIASAAEGFVVRFSGDGPFVVEGITFRHEGEAAADVVVVWGGEVEFARCRFAGAQETEEHRRAGLRLSEHTAGKVHQCVAEENNGAGIAILGQAQPTLEDNHCAANKGSGIYYGDNAGGNARENECLNNWGGIFVAAQAQPTLEGNTCMDNEVVGIGYQDSAGGIALQNECARNLKGIVVTGGAHPELTENTCKDNEDSGITFHESASGLASHNECSGNGAGFVVAGQAQPRLEGNICTDNQHIGILFAENAGGEARQNECLRNRIGFLIEDQALPLLESNACFENNEVGIMYGSSAGGTARQNECTGNGRYGVYIAETADPELIDNDCHDNGEADILDERP